MGKGGGGQAPTKTTSVTTSLPEYAEPFYERLVERTEAESKQDYQPYPGQRFAMFSPEQQESFRTASGIGRAGVPQAFRLGTLRAADAATYQPGYDPGQIRTDIEASAYDPGTYETGSFVDPGVASQYMNPFIENVIDAQERRAQQRFREDMLPGLRAQAVRQGAFGGSRAALTEGLAQARLDERLLDQGSALRAQGYDQAQKTYVEEAARRLKAQQLQEMADLDAAKYGLQGAELADRAAQQRERFGIDTEKLGLESARQLSAFGGLEQQYGLRAADVLRQVGEQRQAQEQQLLDIGYSDFLSQRDFPRQQLGFLSGILHGVPVSPQSETSVYRRPPSAGQQLMGYGLGGLGLAKNIFGSGGQAQG